MTLEICVFIFMVVVVLYMIFDYTYKTALTNALGAILKKLEIMPDKRR